MNLSLKNNKLQKQLKSLEKITLKLDKISKLLSKIKKLNSLKLAGDYESALADFNNAAKLDNAGLKEMNEYFLKLSNQVNISSTELTNLGQNIAKMGVPKNDLKDYLSTASKLQMALGFSVTETSQMLNTLNTHFKLNSKEVLSFGDELFTLSNNFSASAKEIANLTSKISSNAKMFGLSANESAVLSAAFLQVAKDEETAENSINSLNEKLLNITSLGDNVKQSLANIGINAAQIEIGMKIDPKATLDLFFKRLKNTKKANEKQYNELLSSMFGANAAVMNAFVDNLDKYNEATANIGKNKGALDNETKAVKELFNTRVGVFTNQLKTLSIQIGNVFLPIVSSVIDKLSGVLSFVSDMMSKYPTLTKVVITSAGAFMALQVALSTVLVASTLLSKVNLVKNMIYTKNVAMILSGVLGKSSMLFKLAAGAVRIFNLALLSNPIGLVIAMVATLGVIIYKNWDLIKEKTKALCEFLGSVFFTPIEGIKNLFSSLWDSICSAFSAFTNIFSLGAKSLSEFFTSPIEFIKSKFSAIFDWIASKFAWITDTFSSIADFFGFGNEKESKKEVISSKEVEQLNTAVLSAKSEVKQDFSINLSFGEIKVATNNGNFDLNALTEQITVAVIKAIDKANANALNRSIIGG